MTTVIGKAATSAPAIIKMNADSGFASARSPSPDMPLLHRAPAPSGRWIGMVNKWLILRKNAHWRRTSIHRLDVCQLKKDRREQSNFVGNAARQIGRFRFVRWERSGVQCRTSCHLGPMDVQQPAHFSCIKLVRNTT